MLIVNTDKDCDTNDIIKKKYPNNKRKWEEYAKENTSLIDVIIFKMVITEGWDIPRACMLYQVRDTKSKQLDEQVLGRVRRNPRLTDFENLTKEGKELAMKCYVWGYKDKDEGEEVPVELKDKNIRLELTVQTTKLKELTERADFNLDTFLNSTKPSVESQSIFKLNRSLKRASNDVQALVSGYSNSYSKWFHASEHLDDIVNKNNELNCNYSESIILDIQATFPRESYYNKTEITREEDGWIWEKRNKGRTSSTIFNEDDEFSFDSEAEKEWARFLSKISSTCVEHLSVLDLEKRTLLWGKNFLPNSNIKFQYYKNGYHDSYPDFVLKDKKGRIHIFEVKSVNTRTDVGFDTEEYKEKIEELKKMYKEASKVTHQFFYIPVKNGNGWDIFKYEEGEKEEISLEQLIAILKGENK